MKLAALVPGLALAGCGGSKTLLSPKDPTMLSIWHVYGEQADSPMNRLLTEFNDTVGREKGILLNVTNMTNSAAIGGQLQDAKAGKPGALDLPDLFSAHSADASALGIENLVDWNDWFTAEDMAAYVPGFVQDGIIDGRQVVFPVSKSTQLIFLNGSQYARFAADTGAQLSTLATWDGFFEMAGAYRQWSQGKPFCALDYPLRLVELNALEQGSGELYKGSWYDLTNETFRASWMEFARALVQGDILTNRLLLEKMLYLWCRPCCGRRGTFVAEDSIAMPSARKYSTTMTTGRHSSASGFSEMPEITMTGKMMRKHSSILTKQLVT